MVKLGVIVQNWANFTEKTMYTYLLFLFFFFFTKQHYIKEMQKACIVESMLLKVPMTLEG